MARRGYIGKATRNEAQRRSVAADASVESKFHDLPGEIVSFDPATQTASIQPLFEAKFGSTFLKMPQLEEVPVRFERAGKGGMTYPVQVGDKVVLRPQIRDSENYHLKGEYQPKDARYASLSDMEAYVSGGESLMEPIEGFDPANVHIRCNEDGSYGIKINEGGTWEFNGSQGGFIDTLVQYLEELSTDMLLINYGSSAGTGHALEKAALYAQLAAKLRAMTLT